MDITPLAKGQTNLIQSYSSKGIKVNGQIIDHDFIMSSSNSLIIKWNNDNGIFAFESYTQIISFLEKSNKDGNSILIVGTGNKFLLPPSSMLAQLKICNIFPEIMSTQAACRTYNVLALERQNIFAALVNIKH